MVDTILKYSRAPVTWTLKGNEKEFEWLRVRVDGVDCKIQFAILKIDSYNYHYQFLITDFSSLQCIVQCKFNLFHQKQ